MKKICTDLLFVFVVKWNVFHQTNLRPQRQKTWFRILLKYDRLYKGAHQTVMCWGQCHLIIDFIFKISQFNKRFFILMHHATIEASKLEAYIHNIQRQMYQIDRTRSWIGKKKKKKTTTTTQEEEKKSKKEIFKTNKK